MGFRGQGVYEGRRCCEAQGCSIDVSLVNMGTCDKEQVGLEVLFCDKGWGPIEESVDAELVNRNFGLANDNACEIGIT